MKKLFTIFSVFLLAFVAIPEANAQSLDGTYTVIQGNTVTVQIGAAYQSTLKRATNVSYNWSVANSSIAIQSKTSTTCTIKGVTPTEKVRLNYQCSYRYDGYARSMNFYYDITVKSNTVSVTRVDMSPESATMEVGETLQLSATAYPTNATDRSLYWTTENYSVASVDNSGLVTARGAGKVWIWARANDGSGAGNYCAVTVNEPAKVESIELEKSELSLVVGDMFTLAATVLPDKAYNKVVKWASTDDNIATVSNGNITAVNAGECDIICTSTDGSNISATCHVTVAEAPRYWLSVNIPNGSYAIEVTDLSEISIRITPDEGYKVHSVTFDGEEIPDAAASPIITLPKLEADASLNVVLEQDLTAIDDVGSEDSDLLITVCEHTVNVCGLSEGVVIQAYSLNGSLIKSTSEQSFELPAAGIYILRIGSRSFKVAI